MNKLAEHFENILKEVSIDCVIFGFNAGKLKVLLLRWRNTDKWSLPGGRIWIDEAVNDAVNRIVVERTGMKGVFLQQFYAFGNTNRYTHYSEQATLKYIEKAVGVSFEGLNISKRAVSLGYYALVDINKVVPKPDILTEECMWCDLEEVPKLLFDHNEMIDTALTTLRKEIRFSPIGNLLPDKFTLNEIHKLFENILGSALDRRNFHKIITSYDFLVKLSEKRTGSANKSPFLYRFDHRKYHKALKVGISV